MHQVSKILERCIDWFRTLQVDTCVPQQLQRIFGTTRFQEVQVIVQLGAASLQHALAEGDRRRQSGGVLVDVKGPVEMRDPQTLQRQLLVDRKVGTEILFQQLTVDITKRL